MLALLAGEVRLAQRYVEFSRDSDSELTGSPLIVPDLQEQTCEVVSP